MYYTGLPSDMILLFFTACRYSGLFWFPYEVTYYKDIFSVTKTGYSNMDYYLDYSIITICKQIYTL